MSVIIDELVATVAAQHDENDEPGQDRAAGASGDDAAAGGSGQRIHLTVHDLAADLRRVARRQARRIAD